MIDFCERKGRERRRTSIVKPLPVREMDCGMAERDFIRFMGLIPIQVPIAKREKEVIM